MLINARAKLNRLDLQLISNEMCKICIQHEMTPWVEHLPSKQNIIPDVLSKNKHITDDLVHNCTNLTSATDSVQLAVDLCRDVMMNEIHSCHD